MALKIYRYRLIAPTPSKLARFLDPGVTVLVGAPSTDILVDTEIDEAYKDQLDYGMSQYNYEFVAEAPAGLGFPVSFPPNVPVNTVSKAGRLLTQTWYEFYDGPTANPMFRNKSRQDAFTWQGSKLISMTRTYYWADGSILSSVTYSYSTLKDAQGNTLEIGGAP